MADIRATASGRRALTGGMYNLIRRSLLATRGPANEIKKTNGDGAP